MPEELIYTFTGNVLASGGIYIRRKADDELLRLCTDKQFAYVLAPRQVGKSSLVTSTATALSRLEIRTCIIDLNQLGVNVEQEQWYLGQLVMIQDQLGLKTDVIEWWRKKHGLSMTQRMIGFYKSILLHEVPGPVVIFVDEIETTRSLNFTDDFYGAIRSMHNARADEQNLKRLSFVLIGSARPNDLIHDPQRAPFNIAEAVELTDFTLDEARPLADGFGLPAADAEQVLGWILKWTGGHPYLTQRVCRAVLDHERANWSESDVDEAVATTFFGKMSDRDNNLLVVRDMLTRGTLNRSDVLKTYGAIFKGRPVVYDEENSATKAYLKLVGVVHRQKTRLDVRNRIYRKVFNGKWVRKCLAT